MSEPETTPQPEASVNPDAPSKEELRLALKAFRKRLKVTRLDDESRLGYGPMSNGGKSGVVAISPPNQYSRAVWEELAKQGKLKSLGQGLYELTDV